MARKRKIGNVAYYSPSNFGKKEEELHRDFFLQMTDARNYFLNIIKPRLDRSYKLYIAYTGDRQKEIKKWQANIFVPYIQAVIETLMPRILDARPEFSVIGRTEDDNLKAEKQQQLGDYFWEISGMDKTSEDFTRSALLYGIGFLQVSWKKDVRKLKFLKTKDISKKKYEWKEEERVFYDAPFCEWVDNYSLWYDWHNVERQNKQYWFKRLVLTENQIRRRYPMANEDRLKMAFSSGPGVTTDYASVRQTTRATHDGIVKGSQASSSGASVYGDRFSSTNTDITMYEVFEWTRPFDDMYAVMVGGGYVPIFDGGFTPIPFDFKEAPFIEATYLKIPGEFEGYGVPLILENPQIMLNLIKNQRLDAATLNIHKMWIVNPLANINRNELVTRPFGIIYSIDPAGVKEVQFSDIKSSAYKEEEALKSDMRYSSGVDDFSMGVGGGSASATEVRHLRESTLERVRLFVNHLGDAYSDVLRYWMDMSRQLLTKSMTIRIIGQNGEALFPLIERDDLMGRFDYRSRVLPSIAGMQDINKKQSMDLFQLLSQIDPNTSGVDIKKLISKVISNWGWSLDSISSGDEPSIPSDIDQDMLNSMQAGGMAPLDQGAPGNIGQQQIGSDVGSPTDDDMSRVISLLRKDSEFQSPVDAGFQQAGIPINLLNTQGTPPTVSGVPSAGGGPGYMSGGGNQRGFNRGGKVDTNIPVNKKTNVESNLMNRVFSIQR